MDIDEILLEFLKLQSDDYDYDFLHGSLGIGLYFVERHSITNNDYTKKIITEFYTNLLRNIQNNFENVISQKEIDGANSLYFGLAHGIAGILNSIYSSNRYIDFNQDLLKKSILKLLDVLVKNELNNEFFKYPNYYDLDNNLIIKSRLAWCQGDLGIGNSLMNSGLLLEDNDLYFKGQKIISRTFDLDINRCGINDVGICHGISGVLLQKWLYYEKSNIANKSSTTIWREYLKKQTKNYSDFKAFHKGKYVDEINLLEGATGIALTKLTIENKINKNWISCLNLI
jgi:lantibiotic modifying enzyme